MKKVESSVLLVGPAAGQPGAAAVSTGIPKISESSTSQDAPNAATSLTSVPPGPPEMSSQLRDATAAGGLTDAPQLQIPQNSVVTTTSSTQPDVTSQTSVQPTQTAVSAKSKLKESGKLARLFIR